MNRFDLKILICYHLKYERKIEFSHISTKTYMRILKTIGT